MSNLLNYFRPIDWLSMNNLERSLFGCIISLCKLVITSYVVMIASKGFVIGIFVLISEVLKIVFRVNDYLKYIAPYCGTKSEIYVK